MKSDGVSKMKWPTHLWVGHFICGYTAFWRMGVNVGHALRFKNGSGGDGTLETARDHILNY